MTTRYRHTPGHYRNTAAYLADHLGAIADHLAARVEVDPRNGRMRYAAPDGELGRRLDELTDAVVAAERLVVALLVDVEVGALGSEVRA
jgi:hypothetical protein